MSEAHPKGLYGYQWWNNEVPATATNVEPKVENSLKDSLWALGIFGQMIMVNQKENLVIVQWSTPAAGRAVIQRPAAGSVADV